jgi:hypothetical protein
MVFHDSAGVLLRAFTGVFGGDGVKRFLVNQMLGGSRERGETEAETQKSFHADESTGNGRFGEQLWPQICAEGRRSGIWAANSRE